MATDLRVGNYYTFSTYAPAILGQEHVNMKLMGMGDYRLACMFDNVDIKLNNILPYLKQQLGEGVLDDASKDEYFIFQTEAGSTVVFGRSWINMDTMAGISAIVLIIRVENIAQRDANRIRELLSLAGYNNVITKLESIA